MNEEMFVSQNQSYFLLTRILDIMLSLSGLIVLAPVFIIISICIKLEDGGPVIFSQERVGKDGYCFTMYKFRTMVVEAEKQLDSLLKYNEMDGAMFKMKDDPRITTIGKFLRKTSLDECPQLFNVIKGEMSLVGPRPPLVREVEEYTEYDFQRLVVLPGCTGLWQVSGRNRVHFDEMVELDLEFIRHLSLKNYFKILFKTFCVIFQSTGV